MSARIWITHLVVLAAGLEADLGHRKITRSRLIRPLTIASVIGAVWISGAILVGDDRSLAETTGAAYTEQDARAALTWVVLASACRGRVGAGPAPGR